MTEPGRADASRTRIAGVVLLAVAGVAAVVGLLALGGEGPPSHEAAPTSSPPVALPGLTSSTGPVPGPPPDAVQPGQPGGGGPPVGTPIVPGAGPGGGGDVGGLPPVPGPVPGSAAGGVPAVPAGGPGGPGGGNAGGLPPAPGGAPGALRCSWRCSWRCSRCPRWYARHTAGRRVAGGHADRAGRCLRWRGTGACSPAPGPSPVARPGRRGHRRWCARRGARHTAGRRVAGGRPDRARRRSRWRRRGWPAAWSRSRWCSVVLPAVRPVPPRSRSACTTTR